MKQLGLIVNPMAGIGGKVGLKGSDGEEIRKLAFSLGAKQEAPDKVIRALKRMAEAGHDVHIITCPGKMGEDEAKAAGYDPEIIDGIATEITSADDTKKAAEILRRRRYGQRRLQRDRNGHSGGRHSGRRQDPFRRIRRVPYPRRRGS